MKHDTAGDPITGLKWTRRTTAKIAAELHSAGIEVSEKTVARLLKQMGFSLRVNHKKISRTSPEERDSQFTRIAQLREQCAAAGLPIISVDTKKKELVGNFKNAGTAYSREPVQVKDHDFRSDAIGIAIPYSVYDLHANRGTVFVGTSYDTPQFAVDAIARWWRTEGERRYPDAGELVILADAGVKQCTEVPSLAVRTATPALQSPRSDGDCRPPTKRRFKVESRRAQTPQRDQQELGWPSLG